MYGVDAVSKRDLRNEKSLYSGGVSFEMTEQNEDQVTFVLVSNESNILPSVCRLKERSAAVLLAQTAADSIKYLWFNFPGSDANLWNRIRQAS